MNKIIVKLDAFYAEVLELRPRYGLAVSYRDIAKGYECYAEALSSSVARSEVLERPRDNSASR